MDPSIIAFATLATVGRIGALLLFSILSAWILAYGCVKSRRFESTFVPVVNVLESIPVIAFLPIVLLIFINGLGGTVGTEIAVDFLVWDAVVWNIWIGAYQAFKTVPENLIEVADNYRFGWISKLKNLYIPHSIPRLTSNLFSSFADGFFYIAVSEVFIVGTTSYNTFGIGTFLAGFMQQADTVDIAYSLGFIAIAVILVTFALTRMSHWAVARYGTDTVGEISHNKGWLLRFFGPMRGVSKATSKLLPVHYTRLAIEKEPGTNKFAPVGKYVAIGLGLAGVAYLAYSAYSLATSVSNSQWSQFLSITPFLLYSMAADYARVFTITMAALGLSITVGYFAATRKKLSKTLFPIIQGVAAFPAPAYFPLIFIFTIPFFERILPFFYTEIYIFVLGLISCFYYVFFDFWIGVQAIPVQFLEVVRNHEIGFLSKMRRVVIPSTFPYLITGISSTVNSAWAGIQIGEYWPNIFGNYSLNANVGMMKYIASNMAAGNVAAAAYVSLLFAVVVAVYGILFTRNLMDIARKKYVVEEGVFAA